MFIQNSVTLFVTKNSPCRILFLATLALYLVAIPFSKFMMSLAGVILVVNWFLEGFLEKNLWQKFAQAFKSKVVLAILLLFLVHIVWFIPSQDIIYALQDIWIKIPLFFIPIIFYTSKPLTQKEVNIFLHIYVFGVLFSSLYGFFTYLNNDFLDKRTMAVHISYVRFELNICFAIFVSLYLLLQKRINNCIKIITGFVLNWFLFFLVYAGHLTGIILFIIISFVFIVGLVIRHKNSMVRYVIPSVFILILGGSFLFIFDTAKKYFTVPLNSVQLEYTADGNKYTLDFDKHFIENGNYVYANVCDLELRGAWNKRSQIKYEEVDATGSSIQKTLIRYLNSKGLTKDRLAVESLTDEEITHIENGIANIAYTNDFAVIKRIYELFYELNDYYHKGTVVGYSLAQRLELWKVSLSAIEKHFLLGVGTGDVKTVFAKELEETNSPLAFSNKRSHNQYFTFLIAFGIVGLSLILFSIIYPVVILGKFKEPLFLIFFIIVMLSMFTEDTLEPQDGATFFTFFYSFFLFLISRKEYPSSITE